MFWFINNSTLFQAWEDLIIKSQNYVKYKNAGTIQEIPQEYQKVEELVGRGGQNGKKRANSGKKINVVPRKRKLSFESPDESFSSFFPQAKR